MKLLKRTLYKCYYKESSEGFVISGKLPHWTILLLPGLWVSLMLPFLFGEYMILALFSLAPILILTIILTYMYNFQIIVNVNEVIIRLKISIFNFKVIKSKLSDLIINNKDVKNLTLISSRTDFYSEDLKNNLRFSYTTPWDGDESVFYADYNNKELTFDTYCDRFVWEKLIYGLERLQQKVDCSST